MTRPPTFPTGQLIRIAILVVLLVAILVLKRRCGPAAESMVRALDAPASDGGLTSPDTPRK
jgi:hypothetical protein